MYYPMQTPYHFQQEEKRKPRESNIEDKIKKMVEEQVTIKTKNIIEERSPKVTDKVQYPQSNQIEKKTPNLLFRVNHIKNLKGKTLDVKIKNCIVDFNKIAVDDNKIPIQEEIVMYGSQDPQKGTVLYDYEKLVLLDYESWIKNGRKNQLSRVYWYSQFTDVENGQLIGWIMPKLFRDYDKTLELNYAIFRQNVLGGVPQKPPFKEQEVTRSQYTIEYIIQNVGQFQDELPIIDTIMEPEENDNGQRVQILIERAVNINQKREMSYFLAIMNVDEMLVDRKQKPLEQTDNLEIDFRKNNSNKNIFNFQQDHVFDAGDIFFRKQVKQIQRQNAIIYIELFDYQGDSVGITTISLFKNKTELNFGKHVVPLQEIDEDGNRNDLQGTIEFIFQIEKPKKQKYFDPDKGTYVCIFKLLNFKERFDPYFKILFIVKNEIMNDSDGQKAIFNSVIYERNKQFKYVEVQAGVEMPVNYKKVLYQQKYNPSNFKTIGIIIEFTEKVEDPLTKVIKGEKKFGWIIHPMFTTDGLLNRGKYNDVQLLKPPVIQKMPQDISLIEKLECTINYEINSCLLNDDALGYVQSSGDSLDEND